MRDTRLSSREMNRISRMFVDWEALAGLMDIPAAVKDNIRDSPSLYPDAKSRTEKVLDIFNKSSDFCRDKLAKYFEDLKDLELAQRFRTHSLRGLLVVG